MVYLSKNGWIFPWQTVSHNQRVMISPGHKVTTGLDLVGLWMGITMVGKKKTLKLGYGALTTVVLQYSYVCIYIYTMCIYIYIYTMCIYIYTHRHSISMHLICTYNWNCSPLKGQQDSRKAQHSDFAWHVHGPASSPFFII